MKASYSLYFSRTFFDTELYFLSLSLFGLIFQLFPFNGRELGGRRGACITLSDRSKSDSFVRGSSFENCDFPKLCTIADVFVSENGDIWFGDLSVEIEFAYTTDRPFNNSNSPIVIGNEDRTFFIIADIPHT
jgi:hypothetical protein